MKISLIESFCTEFVGFVRVTAEDGSIGWGQLSTFNADITQKVLHRQVGEGGDVHCQVAAGVVAAGVAGLDLADKQGLKWSAGEMQALQAALAKFPAGASDRWDQIAKAVPCKTVKDVMAQVILGP